MAAARYWRLFGIETYAGGDLELSEIALYSGASRIDGAATLTSSHTPVAGSLADLKDGSTSTACRFAAADVRSAGFYLQWDFASSVNIGELKLGSASSSARFLTAATLVQGASVGAWSYVATLSGVVYPGAGALTASSDAGFAPTTWNPADKGSACILSNANLTAQCEKINGPVRSVFGASTGKWYWEIANPSGRAPITGVGTAGASLGDWPGFDANGWSYYLATGRKVHNGVQTGYGAGWDYSPPVIGVALDMDAGTLAFFLNGVSKGVAFTGITGTVYAMTGGDANGQTSGSTANFGATAFAYTPPDGYTAGFGSTVMGLPQMATASVHTLYAGYVTAGSSVVDSHRMPASLDVSMARDVEHGGIGTIYGTTKTKGTPNTPAKARVVLLHQRSKQPVRETWSDPATGAFEFRGIDTAQQFLTLAEDADGNFRPVAASMLVPEALP